MTNAQNFNTATATVLATEVEVGDVVGRVGTVEAIAEGVARSVKLYMIDSHGFMTVRSYERWNHLQVTRTGSNNNEDGDIAIVRDFTGQRYLFDTLDGNMAPIGG